FDGSWSLSSDEHLQSRERKRSGDVVDDVHLACVQTGLERCRGQVELEYGRVPIRIGDGGRLHDGRFERAEPTAKERDAREHANRTCAWSAVGGRARRIV